MGNWNVAITGVWPAATEALEEIDPKHIEKKVVFAVIANNLYIMFVF